jgi:hypothetical protein
VNTLPDIGFVYVATGDSYYREAAHSAASLRRHHPHHRICLVTDRARGPAFWDDLVVLEKPAFGFRDKLTMLSCPYERFVFLDTDTTVFGPLDELFSVLETMDVCGVQMFEGQDYIMPGIPHSFCEMNSGMLGVRRSPLVNAFFDSWNRHYLEFVNQNKSGHYHYANVGDQKSLRAALWETPVRIGNVGPEFNFIPFKMDFATLPVRVLHTRATNNLEPLVARLNAQLGRRAYVPLLDTVVSDNPPPAELRRLLLACLRQLLRAFSRACTPRTLRNRLRSHPWIRTRFLVGRHLANDHYTNAKWARPPS